jgi:hypothetical protein
MGDLDEASCFTSKRRRQSKPCPISDLQRGSLVNMIHGASVSCLCQAVSCGRVESV